MPYSFSEFEKQFKKIKDWLAAEFGVLRSGRVNPAMLKGIVVESYGEKTNLENLASIGVGDTRTLVIQPWDKANLGAIEKAIRSSNTGLEPIVDKEVIRTVLPELTGERREALLKIVGEKLEDARVSLRQARDNVWKEIQEQERKKEMSEDEKFRKKDELQKKMDAFNQELEKLAGQKRREIQS